DGHALEAVHGLDLLDDVALDFGVAGDAQDVVRIDGAVAELVAAAHAVAGVHRHVLAARNQVGFLQRLAALDFGLRITGVGGHDDPLLAALDVAERDDAVDGRHHGRALRATRLEQFGHARKTAGDVAGLAGRSCDLDERVAGVDRVAVAELKVGVLREGVTAQLGAVRIDDVDVRVQAGALVAQDAHALHAGGVVELGHVRDAFLE